MAGLINRLFAKQINAAVRQGIANLYNENIYRWANDDMPVMKPDDFDYIDDAFLTVGAVYEVTDLIAKKIASYPVVVKRVVDKKQARKAALLEKSDKLGDRILARVAKAKAYEEVDIPAISKLLDTPNKKQTWNDFIQVNVLNYLLTGNAFIYGNGGTPSNKKWTEIFPLPADMYIRSGGMFEPVKGYTLWWNTDKAKDFPADQVAHVRTANPKYDTAGTQLYGISPLRAYLFDLYAAKFGQDSLLKLLKNGGLIGLLAPKHKEDQMGAEQRDGLKQALTKGLSSNEKYARLIPSSIGMEFISIGLPSTDLELLPVAKATRENIYRAYHMPLSYASGDNSAYNNQNSDDKRLINNAIAPIADVFSDALTRFIGKAYGDVVIEIDWASAWELNEDTKEVMAWVKDALATGVLTPDEARFVLGWGETGLPHMTEHYGTRNMVRLRDVGNESGAI